MSRRAGGDPGAAPGPGFLPAELGPNWAALPLPAIILDAQGRIAAMNDLAEAFLNISRRSSLGLALEGPEILKRLRIVPPLGSILDRVREGHEALNRPGVRFEIGDRSGGHSDRLATLHAGPAPSPPGGTTVLMAPSDGGGGRLGQGQAARSAARAAIGMAEMLAHEIKNPLAGIRGAAQLIGMNLTAEDRELADLIVAESRRILELLEQVERFGDTSAPRLAAVNVHDVLERVRRLAAVGFAKDIRIVADYDPSLPPALADADQLVQVCLNLVRNAAEAISRTGQGGTVRLRSFYDGSLRLASSDAEPQGRSLPLQVEIEDDGPGIPDTLIAEVFEPFVSGRENGTGLGLALVSKIVADHGAWIALDSRPGRTVFRLSLPKA